MQIRFFLLILLFCLSVNAYGLQPHIENKKQQHTLSKQPKVQKNKQAVTKKNKAEKEKPFIPSDKVSPDVPVSFPADI